MKANSKIDIIKMKCMEKSTSKPLGKNVPEPKWIEDEAINISFDMEEETDDAIL